MVLRPARSFKRRSGVDRASDAARALHPSLHHSNRLIMYSLSTCWNSHRHTDGRAMLREIRDLGFEYAELSHGTRISLLPGILEAVDAGEMKISSLHNFCPLPMGVTHAAPNLYQFSAERPARARTGRALHAQDHRVRRPRQGAAGRAALRQHRHEELHRQAARPGRPRREGDRPNTRSSAPKLDEKREAKKEPFVERVNEVAEEAPAGSRSARHQAGHRKPRGAGGTAAGKRFPVPFPRTDQPEPRSIGTTPATPRSRRTSGSSTTPCIWNRCATASSGFHIHDVQFPGRDHCAPGTGTIDFAALKPLVKPEHIKVFEFSPGADRGR